MPLRTIDADNELDRWRYACPAGHTQWRPTNRHFHCPVCARQAEQSPDLADDLNPEFDELLDKQTDELLHRDVVEITGYKAKTA